MERVTRALDTWVDPDRVRDAIAVVLEEAAKTVEDPRYTRNAAGHAAAIRALKDKP